MYYSQLISIKLNKPVVYSTDHELYCSSTRYHTGIIDSLFDAANLVYLDCHARVIMGLPKLPRCKILFCEYNVLMELPDLPKCEILRCFCNRLKSLPDLPNCEILNCQGNVLTRLPNLPKCREVYWSDNMM